MDTERTRISTTATSGAATASFARAQRRLLDRYGVDARPQYVDVGSTGRRAEVLRSGKGPPLVMVIGGAVPGSFWIPLLGELEGHTLYVVELPGFGLTDPAPYSSPTLRRTAIEHLAGILDSLGVGAAPFVTQSMGSQWTAWLAAEQPGRVISQVMVGCPAFFLDTSAILPFRLASVPGLGTLLMSLQTPSAKNAEKIIQMVGERPEGLEEIRDVLVAAQRLPAYKSSLLSLMRSVMSWTRPRSSIVTRADQIRRVEHPVRLIWGEGDTFGSAESGRRMADLMPDADFHLVPGGHAPWLHGAELVGGLTRDFLRHRS